MVSKKLLGQKLRQLRKYDLRMKTQFEMANRLRVPAYKVCNWENGVSFPDAAELLAVLALCSDETRAKFFSNIEATETKVLLHPPGQLSSIPDDDSRPGGLRSHGRIIPKYSGKRSRKA